MWIRSGIWEGTITKENLQKFADVINNDMAPTMRTFPGVRWVKVLWPRKFENREPVMFCQSLVGFDDPSGVAQMLIAKEVPELRGRVHALNTLYVGTLSHIEYELV